MPNQKGPRDRLPKTRRQQQMATARAAAERRARQRRWIWGGSVGVALAAVVAGVLVAASHGSNSGHGGGTTSTNPTSFALPQLNGDGEIRLADFRGKPTVVNFFASWCTSCQFELPGFSRISRQLTGKVNFIGVDSLETGDGMSMARQYGIDWWPLAHDIDGQQDSGLHDDLGGQGMPITAFYDASGKLLFVNPGALPESELRSRIHDLYNISVASS